MKALGFAHDEARRVELGMECCECAEPFVRAHNAITACQHCWPKLSAEERKIVLRAEYPEATANHFRTEARKRRDKKNGDGA